MAPFDPGPDAFGRQGFPADHRLMIIDVSVTRSGEAPGSRDINQDRSAAQGPHVWFYRAALPLSHRILTFVSGLIPCAPHAGGLAQAQPGQ
jgi:hypothetical protein